VLILIGLGIGNKLEAFSFTFAFVDNKFAFCNVRLKSIPQSKAVDTVSIVVPEMLC
jgi:hypothetical protein